MLRWQVSRIGWMAADAPQAHSWPSIHVVKTLVMENCLYSRGSSMWTTGNLVKTRDSSARITASAIRATESSVRNTGSAIRTTGASLRNTGRSESKIRKEIH